MKIERLAMLKQWGIALGVLTLAAASPAAAQLAQNSKAPVDVTADSLEVVNAQCLAIYSGSAEAMQDTARLRANVLKSYMQVKPTVRPGAAGGACGDLVRMEALGNVYYATPLQRMHGDSAIYDAGADTITMTGNVVMVQGKNVLRGETIVVKISTGDATVQTGVKGRNKPGRVRGVFYPTQQPAAPAPTPR
jgi:lipopolysaccharide export system protein LptA